MTPSFGLFTSGACPLDGLSGSLPGSQGCDAPGRARNLLSLRSPWGPRPEIFSLRENILASPGDPG